MVAVWTEAVFYVRSVQCSRWAGLSAYTERAGWIAGKFGRAKTAVKLQWDGVATVHPPDSTSLDCPCQTHRHHEQRLYPLRAAPPTHRYPFRRLVLRRPPRLHLLRRETETSYVLSTHIYISLHVYKNIGLHKVDWLTRPSQTAFPTSSKHPARTSTMSWPLCAPPTSSRATSPNKNAA